MNSRARWRGWRRAGIIVPLVLLALLVMLSIVVALLVGSLQVTPAELWAAVTGSASGSGGLVLELRLPRALAAFACGALLALAGALMQVLLRNPLADPYVLGISGGAGVGAMSGLCCGLSLWAVDALAFAGALLAMLTVFGLARGDGSWTQTRLLLTGVIVAAGCGALIALMLSLAEDGRVHGMLFWLMGDLGQTFVWWPAMLVLVVAGTIALTQGVRKIPIQYAKRVVGRKVYGGQSTYMPLRVNYSGVMPIAAASLRYFSISAFCVVRNASGSEPTASLASSSWRFLYSGD